MLSFLGVAVLLAVPAGNEGAAVWGRETLRLQPQRTRAPAPECGFLDPARLAIARISSIQSCSERQPGCRTTRVWFLPSISSSLKVSFRLLIAPLGF
jgi:hypothetical protein